MNKNFLSLAFAGLVILNGMVFAGDFGSAGAENQSDYSLKEMLQYALEDEHMALAEYEALMEEFGLTRPYSNIAQSEKTHISWLEGLYKDYQISVPIINTADHIVLPETLREAAEIAVQAEINNIAMYEKFLKQDLPEDVAEVFTLLKNASQNHLRAFQRQVSSTAGTSQGRGRNRG
ncbi:DUF2202 domain-containing protein [Oceanispirochaeta sp.]|jgi:hypothetical protein|uniref:ferritin-like domain-containing protein n=1 Tax=Oceanispirochaeta sp. TaxID=2035350 RepID=UPI00261C5045|nr:DUF2202 domain-containing protein [Oceanispirochaeta sp.]MDA3956249.1 DUF2202 domain-containing protein [Oceanispirochaeta sp.]